MCRRWYSSRSRAVDNSNGSSASGDGIVRGQIKEYFQGLQYELVGTSLGVARYMWWLGTLSMCRWWYSPRKFDRALGTIQGVVQVYRVSSGGKGTGGWVGRGWRHGGGGGSSIYTKKFRLDPGGQSRSGGICPAGDFLVSMIGISGPRLLDELSVGIMLVCTISMVITQLADISSSVRF
jgi:hypothetical protein